MEIVPQCTITNMFEVNQKRNVSANIQKIKEREDKKNQTEIIKLKSIITQIECSVNEHNSRIKGQKNINELEIEYQKLKIKEQNKQRKQHEKY